VAALLLSVTLFSSALPAYADAANQSQTQAFIQVAQNAQALAERLLAAMPQGSDTTDASALISEGKALLQEAQTAYVQDDYPVAILKATQAQDKFKQAIVSLTSADSIQSQSDEVEKRLGILEAIRRARERLDRLKSILASIQTNSDSQAILTIQNLLSDAEAALNNAEAIIKSNPPSAQDAAKYLAQAEADLGRATGELNQLAHAANAQRGEGVLKGLENQVRVLGEQIDKAAAKGVKVDDLKSQLVEVQILIDAAHQKFASGDVAGAVAIVQQAKQLIHVIRQALAHRHR
jgi:tetratricopeptide (TPR) repeat protein